MCLVSSRVKNEGSEVSEPGGESTSTSSYVLGRCFNVSVLGYNRGGVS